MLRPRGGVRIVAPAPKPVRASGRVQSKRPIRDSFEGDVRFFVAYIWEPHPKKGWQVDVNLTEGLLIWPKTF